ncbi:DIP1984 family protein [Bacillus sp. MCCB 382]|uniref:DIP1984 family protein n=1 Tax=Bacillus sp. MCCB 382 TaxID=2860197 RepID=UPI001C57628C|nr:DIP1984 family protein [Bacillus sp. MCCB 382]
MKLAEALIMRSDFQKRVEHLRNRLIQNVVVQEGDLPGEEPKELMKDLTEHLHQLEELIIQINKTNLLTEYDKGLTLADALTKRDLLGRERQIYSDLLEHANVRHDRYSRTEIKHVSTIDIRKTQKLVDELSKNYRLIDMKIQELNWKTDLLE